MTRKKKKLATVVLGDSMSDSDLLYLTRFASGDPFLYVKIGSRSTILLTDFEVGRAQEESAVDKVLPISTYLEKAESNDLADALAVFLDEKNVTHLTLPARFPFSAAEKLRGHGFVLEIAEDPFVHEREQKDSYEIKLITQTLRKTEKALETAIRWIQSSSVRRGTLYVGGRPLTAEMVRKRIHLDLMESDCLALAGTIVACGDQAVDPHNQGHGPLKANKPIVLDVFPRSQTTHYWGDITRTVVKGKASERVRKMFHTVREGQRIGIGMIKPGVRGDKVHGAIVEYFQKQGFETGILNGKFQGFIHGTGHGVGLDIHEAPRVSKVNLKLKAGHVVTVEPGLYYLGHGGIRIEDMVAVTATGAKNLTKMPKILEV
ncbi:MAG: aminopeptidase P family protein [Candidatus Eisenbacteria bacterium]|nr:aminopeptidase P family protein [Candidatus Eisenbacteria bacterium]